MTVRRLHRSRALFFSVLPCAGAALAGCGQEDTTAALRALDVSGDVSVVCLARDETGAFTQAMDRSACPDAESIPGSPGERHLHLLVTQPVSGEVALVDLNASPSEAVIDFEPSQPGYSFLPVGAEPGSIVSTRGGVASFVAVSETGREGIFGLPSSCIGARSESQPLRDIRTWPACRLPAAPGPLVLLEDPAIDHDQDASTPARVRARCGGEYVLPEELAGQAPAATREECPADLASEARPIGRRKLAVALPSLSQIWVIDAQELLDRAPGSFDDCSPEVELTLSVEPLDVAPRVPEDLTPSAPQCAPQGYSHGPAPANVRPRPIDFALDEEGRLFVADGEAPVIHVLDASNPCEVSSLPALHPLSYTDPNAVITTRRLAVSPLTPLGKRFVYAVDGSTTQTAGTLLAFDVSPGSTERTPIIRERASFTPGEPPDRIVLPRDVADVEFVFQDFPEPDPNTGIAVEGVLCDPDPSVPDDSPAARYRTRPDLSAGARPAKLRGTFAMAALHSGQLAVVDVEDLDAACRRPVSVNPEPEEDLSGCKNDDPGLLPAGYEDNGLPTVSNELSCNVVVPHRARSRSFFTNAFGTVRSAGLLAFPTLTLATGRSVASDQSDEGRDQPKMLGARFAPGEAAELYVGPLLYRTGEAGSDLELDPSLADRSSLLLSYQEPRAFAPGEDFTAIYEGPVRGVSRAILRVDEATGLGVVDEGLNALFCSSGVQDMALTAEVGRGRGVAAGADLERFVRRHADYVQLTGPLLEAEDVHWQPGNPGAECGAELFASDGSPAELRGRPLCEQFFGLPEVPTPGRDLRIVEASEDQLLVEPRDFDPNANSETRRLRLVEFASCCFPGATTFQVRAGHQWVVRGGVTGLSHRVTTDPESRRCVEDCSPLVQRNAGRVFEVSCSNDCPRDARNLPPVGPARPGEDFVCVVDDTSGGIEPGEPGSECIFQSLTTRFAIYRGQRPSERDTLFRWQFSDGFSPLTLSLSSTDRPRSSPRSLLALPELGQLLVTDGSAPGITFVATGSTTLGTTSIY